MGEQFDGTMRFGTLCHTCCKSKKSTRIGRCENTTISRWYISFSCLYRAAAKQVGFKVEFLAVLAISRWGSGEEGTAANLLELKV